MGKNKKVLRYVSLINMLILSICIISTNTIESFNKNESRYNDVIIFYPQHQNDEIVLSGSAIVKMIKEKGSKNIFVVLVSNGFNVNILNDERLNVFSTVEKNNLTKNEFKRALEELGVLKENIIFLDEIALKPEFKFHAMREVALEFEDRYKGNITHIAHSYEYENEYEHIKNGKIIKELYDKGDIDSCMFFTKVEYDKKISIEKKIYIPLTSKRDYKKIEEACKMYKIENIEEGLYGIGYKFNYKLFDKILNDKKIVSILHLP